VSYILEGQNLDTFCALGTLTKILTRGYLPFYTNCVNFFFSRLRLSLSFSLFLISAFLSHLSSQPSPSSSSSSTTPLPKSTTVTVTVPISPPTLLPNDVVFFLLNFLQRLLLLPLSLVFFLSPFNPSRYFGHHLGSQTQEILFRSSTSWGPVHGYHNTHNLSHRSHHLRVSIAQHSDTFHCGEPQQQPQPRCFW
jgi:hypothetical protein